jgi:glyceraldehyde-3-phosphate dehydrogenase (NAD(P))
LTLWVCISVNVTLEDAPTAGEVWDLLAGESRLFLIEESLDIDGAGKLKEFAMDAGRPRGDIWENAVWAESITVEDGVAPSGHRDGGGDAAGADLYLFQAIHQESDVVPENVDAIRAVLGTADAAESRETTDEALGMGL